MKPAKSSPVRAVKRLSEAMGYLELGMPQHALASLDKISDPGPFEAVAEILRGEAARAQHRLGDAVTSFEKAARLLPSPGDRVMWLALSRYYRQAGNTARAVAALAHARGAHPPSLPPKKAQ